MSSIVLRPHQQEVADKTHAVDRLAYLWSPRLGKTHLAISFLLSRSVKRAVVSCPLVVAPTWHKLLEAAGMTVLNAYKGPLRALQGGLSGDGVLLLNDDRLHALKNVILKWKPEAYIGDESHRFRGVSSARGRAMRAIAKKTQLVRLLTGTPTPNHAGNLWGQMTAINAEMWESSYERFARRFLVRDAMFPSRVLGVINEHELRSMLVTSSHILRREDVYGPDTWQTVYRDVELPTKARKLYNTLVKDWLAENTFGKDEQIAVPHMLKRMVRLQQLTSGYITDDQGTTHEVHTAKIDAVVNDLEDILNAGEKAVIFHRFTWEGDIYKREIERRLNVYLGIIDGSTSARAREDVVQSIGSDAGHRVALVQTQAGGIGISLAACTHALFVSQSFNFDDEEQARDRIYEPGARKVVTYYGVPSTIDMYIGRVLESKADIHESIRHADIRELAFGEVKQDKRGMF